MYLPNISSHTKYALEKPALSKKGNYEIPERIKKRQK